MHIQNPTDLGAKAPPVKKSHAEKIKKSLFSLFDRELSVHEQAVDS